LLRICYGEALVAPNSSLPSTPPDLRRRRLHRRHVFIRRSQSIPARQRRRHIHPPTWNRFATALDSRNVRRRIANTGLPLLPKFNLRISLPAKITAALSSAWDRIKSEIGGCGMIRFWHPNRQRNFRYATFILGSGVVPDASVEG
jgi:hypothetical protein